MPQHYKKFKDIAQVNRVKKRLEDAQYVSVYAIEELEDYDSDPLNYQFDTKYPLRGLGINKMDDKLKPVTEKRECLAATFCQIAGRKLTTCTVVDRCPIKNCKFKNNHETKQQTEKIQFQLSKVEYPTNGANDIRKMIKQRLNTQ